MPEALDGDDIEQERDTDFVQTERASDGLTVVSLIGNPSRLLLHASPDDVDGSVEFEAIFGHEKPSLDFTIKDSSSDDAKFYNDFAQVTVCWTVKDAELIRDFLNEFIARAKL